MDHIEVAHAANINIDAADVSHRAAGGLHRGLDILAHLLGLGFDIAYTDDTAVGTLGRHPGNECQSAAGLGYDRLREMPAWPTDATGYDLLSCHDAFPLSLHGLVHCAPDHGACNLGAAMRFAAYLAFLFLLIPSSMAAPHITDPWPDLDQLGYIIPQPVTFQSSSPFTPAEAARGVGAPASVPAQLYLPPHATPDRGTPAVVLLHGAAGLVQERGAAYGAQLAAMGVAALVVDTFGARRHLASSFIGRVIHITETMFVADAYAALRYLASRPEIDARHVVLAGFSWGGMATTYALYAQLADAMAPPGLRFAGHIAFYAPCIARFANSRTTGAPLLMLYGTADELIRPDRCAEIAADLRAGGSTVTVTAYPGAVHQWDGRLHRRLIGRNLSGCRFRVARDGTVRDARTWLPMTGPLLRGAILALCVSRRPYPIGRDDSVRVQSNRDVGRFLQGVFAAE